MLSSLDVYRPAAQKQLELLGSQNNIQTIPIIEGQLPIEITQRTLAAASLSGSDVIIFDTAGRTQIDSVMMSELNNLKQIINPIETFLVADSLSARTGADNLPIFGCSQANVVSWCVVYNATADKIQMIYRVGGTAFSIPIYSC